MAIESTPSEKETSKKPEADQQFPGLHDVSELVRSSASDMITSKRFGTEIREKVLPVNIKIDTESNLPEIAVQIKYFCEKIRLDTTSVNELIIATMEMVRNVQIHTPGGGMVLRVIHDGTREGVRAEIWDTGMGMEPEFIEKITNDDSDLRASGFALVKETTDVFRVVSGPNGTQIFLEKYKK